MNELRTTASPRSRVRPRRRRVAASSLLGLLLALTACTGDDPDRPTPSPSPSPTPTPTEPPEPPPAPRADACYRLTLEDATAPTSDAEPVPCRRRHTARTIHVGRLAAVAPGRPAVDSPRVQRGIARTCTARFAAVVNGTPETRALSRLQVVWFSPTLAEYDAGADRFRCDVIAFGKGDDLLPLPRRGVRGLLDRPDALATFGLCGTARPGTRGFTRVACAFRHSWVAVATIPIEGGRRFPGAGRVRAAGDEACAELVRSQAGLPLEFSYGWEWPTRRQWAAGQRYGFCWAPA
jgi:hypothetical protein